MKRLLLSTLASLLLAATASHAQQPAPTASAPSATPVQPTMPAALTNADALPCHVLTGRVTNSSNQPLTGATVTLRSRTKGFNVEPGITNAEGEYLLNSKQPIPLNTMLEISAGGYNTFAQPLTNCQLVEASLEPLPGTRFKSDGRIKKTKASGKIH